MNVGRAAVAVVIAGMLGGNAWVASAQMQTPTGPPPSSGTNPFLGSTPKGTVTSEALALSAKDAVMRALQNNLGLLLQEEAEASAHGAKWQALADLLPNVSGSLSAQRQVINLEAFGFNPSAFGLPSPLVGPFPIFDARAFASAPIVDLSALNASRAASANEKAAKYSVKNARELVVLVTLNLYLEAVAASARIDSVHAQLQTAQELLKQAQDLKAAGVVASLDVIRAQVQVQTQLQRSISAENDYEKTKLQLAHAIGVPVGQPLTLTDKMPNVPLPPPAVDESITRALDTRADYLAAKSRVEAAQLADRAANDALLPSFHVDANYGVIGTTPSGALGTYSMAATVKIPVFDAGRTKARRIEAASALRQREAELADYKSRVEFEVRSALLDLRAADQQLQAAQTSVQLANDELSQARDRFAAGVAGNLDVTQAQESVARASDVYVDALYAHNLAKALFAQSLGVAESAVMAFLGGGK
jgi:outer membrane protein TolC